LCNSTTIFVTGKEMHQIDGTINLYDLGMPGVKTFKLSPEK